MMNKLDFYRAIEKGTIQGACRYKEYWFIYSNIHSLFEKCRVLELGAGMGELGAILTREGYDVTATEIDHMALRYQKDRGVNAIHARDIDKIEDESFDVVVAASSIEHFDPDNDGDIPAIKYARRVLKKNGFFIVTIPFNNVYIHNRYAGHPIHPPEKVYDITQYTARFLNMGDFEEIKREAWKWSEKQPLGYVPHPTWVQRKGIISTEDVTKLSEANGLCVLLQKR